MKNVFIAIATFLIWISSTAQACPCGCGAVNAQVMYPGESWRFASTLTHDLGFATVDAYGKVGTESSPETRQTLTLGLARAFTESFSGTFSLPIETNRHSDEGTNTGLSDPSISLRYTAFQQNFATPYLPGVQVFATYKHAVAKSIYDDFESEHQLDIHGNGLHEYVAGIDVWYDLSSWKAGLQQSVIAPQRRAIESVDGSHRSLEPGRGDKSALAFGYNWIGQGQLLANVEREIREPLAIEGSRIANSEKIVHSTGLVGSLPAGPRQTLGASYKKTAAFGRNQNTSRADSYSLYFMKAI